MVGSPLRFKCFKVDNLEHLFYRCRDVRSIWEHVLSEMKNKFTLQEDSVSVKSVLFGCLAPLAANLITLLAKQYVVANKLNQSQSNPLSTEGASEAVTCHLRVEKNIA